MRKPTVPELLDRLEKFYGRQEPCWPVDPYEFLVWWYCGYPASDAACAKGWEKLTEEVGVTPRNLLDAMREEEMTVQAVQDRFPQCEKF